MPSEAELLPIEIALRDSRHTSVIMALDRLVLLPSTKAEMKRSMEDLKEVKAFVENALPPHCIPAAEEVFVEHGLAMKEHFLGSEQGGAA